MTNYPKRAILENNPMADCPPKEESDMRQSKKSQLCIFVSLVMTSSKATATAS